jgi:light-regulated signal transduction histidine kinase (bacteriophytochrome)
MTTCRPVDPKLLSLVVHELRTPTSVVAGYLSMLQRDAAMSLGERHRRMIDEAARSCARLATLLAELSEVAKLDAGATTMAEQRFDLFPLLQNIAENVRESQDGDVRFEVRGEPAGATIVGDLTRLRSAFSAIFHALLRERASACTIVAERRLERHGAVMSAVVVVAEDGSEQEAYAADPGCFDDMRGGLGLALPLALRVIECHGGRVWAPAGPMGREAAIVSLPVLDEDADARAGSPELPVESGRNV